MNGISVVNVRTGVWLVVRQRFDTRDVHDRNFASQPNVWTVDSYWPTEDEATARWSFLLNRDD